jgi:hypothetical protein
MSHIDQPCQLRIEQGDINILPLAGALPIMQG